MPRPLVVVTNCSSTPPPVAMDDAHTAWLKFRLRSLRRSLAPAPPSLQLAPPSSPSSSSKCFMGPKTRPRPHCLMPGLRSEASDGPDGPDGPKESCSRVRTLLQAKRKLIKPRGLTLPPLLPLLPLLPQTDLRADVRGSGGSIWL